MEYIKTIIEHVLPIVISIVTPVLVYLLLRGIRYLEAKLVVDVSEGTEVALKEVLLRAIAFAEEQGMKAIKSGGKMESAKKLDAALEFAVGEIKRMGLAEMTAGELTRLIEAMLNRQR
ncbi:MAG: hypothetical protein AB1442_16860 [Nitrospirota bacterium]